MLKNGEYGIGISSGEKIFCGVIAVNSQEKWMGVNGECAFSLLEKEMEEPLCVD